MKKYERRKTGRLFVMILTAVMIITTVFVILPQMATTAYAETETVVPGDVFDGVVLRIRPTGSHKPISVDHDGSKGEDALHLYYLGHSTHFLFERVGDTDNYRIRYYDNFYTENPKSNTCVDVGHGTDTGRMEEKAEIHIKYEDPSSRSQQWQIIRTSNNTYNIRNVYSGKYWSLDKTSERKKNNNKVVQRTQPIDFDWSFEIIGYKTKIDQEKVDWDRLKEYDSLNFEYQGETVTSRNWMSKLPDDLKITDISIPGTHDSGSANIPSDGDKRTQQHYIDELMNAGIRHFDLRLGLTDDGALKIIHTPAGIAYGHYGEILTLDLVMQWADEFLTANPDEVLIFQIKQDDDRDVVKDTAYNYFLNLAEDPDSRLWVGDHVPTLGEARGKIVLISRLGKSGLDYTIERDGERLRWGIDAKNWPESYNYNYNQIVITFSVLFSMGLSVSGPDYEVWTQDDWSRVPSEKKDYIEGSLNGLEKKSREGDPPGKWSSAYFHDSALKNGKNAFTFNYTSCSYGAAYTSHDNSKNIHQWIFDGKLFRDDPTSDGQYDPVPMGSSMYTGIMAFDYADELCAKKVYITNFNKTWITIRGITGDGKEPFDPIVLPVSKGATVHDTYWYGLNSIERDWGTRQPTIVNHFTGNGYTPITTTDQYDTVVRLTDKPMTEYKSKEEFDAAVLETDKQVAQDGMTLYVGLEGRVDNVDVTLEVPLCGTEINDEGKPAPNVTVPDGAPYVVKPETSHWANSSSTGSLVSLPGKMMGYAFYNECFDLEPVFGYHFADNGTVNITNGTETQIEWTKDNLENGTSGPSRLCIEAEVRCVDDYQKIDGVEPTCTQPGNLEYSKCAGCGLLFMDGKLFAYESMTYLRPLGHEAGEPVDEETSATCTEAGSHDQVVYCSRCGEELSRTTISDPAFGHEWIVDENTNQDGWSKESTGEYIHEERKCSRCNTVEERDYRSDHIHGVGPIGISPEVPPTCTTPGIIEHYLCGCGTGNGTPIKKTDEDGWVPMTEEELIIPATGHTPKSPAMENVTPPTCMTAGGYDEVVYCETCNAVISSQYVVQEPLSHEWSEPTYEADWEGRGTVTATRVCERDSEHIDAETAEIKENITIAPACEEKGSKYYYAEFKNEAFETQQSDALEIDALGHMWDDGTVTKEPTCEEEGVRTFTCTREGCGQTRTEAIAALGHEEAIRTFPETNTATCTEGGTMQGERYCRGCGEVLGTVELTTEPLGHVWDIPGYTWANDQSSVTAARICTRDGCSESETETVQTTEVMIKEATCTDDGEKRLEAVFENEDFEKQTDYVNVKALGHDWDEWTVTKEATATVAGEKQRICKRDRSHIEKQTTPAKGYAPGTDPDQKGTDGTAVGPGASAAAAEQAITGMTSDSDPEGSVYNKLKLRSTKQTKKAITLKWTKPSKATKFVLYGNKCGSKNKMKKLGTYTGSSKKLTKVAGAKIKKGTYYKFIMVALDKNNSVVSTSKVIHIATTGGKVTNPKKVTVKKGKKTVSKVTVKKGKTVTVKNTVTRASKKLKLKTHRKVMYESSNKKIATVTSKGKIKGLKKGTCYIFAYAQNGVSKKVKVVVK